MKKGLATLVFGGIILTSMPARADIVFGADVYKAFIDTSQELDFYGEDNYDTIAAVLGFDFSGVGIEGFYRTGDDVINNNNRTSKLSSYGVDFVLRLPTSEYIDFVGSAGYVKYNLETDLKEFETDGLRLGIGLQFNFNKYMAIRAMYHYSALTEEINDIKSINEISAGIRIKF